MNVNDIDTRHATQNVFELSRGNCYPFTGFPFGIQYFSVETNNENWWFRPEAKHFRGIRLTHQPTMWAQSKGDYCSLRILPVSKRTKNMIDFAYNPDLSEFHPNTLSLYQDNNESTTTVYPSENGAIIQFITYEEDKGIVLSFPADGEIISVTGDVIKGVSKQAHIRTKAGLEMSFVMKANATIKETKQLDEEHLQIIFEDSPVLELRLGTSYLGMEKAEKNIPTETKEVLKNNLTEAWNNKLEKITVKDHDKEKVQTFYHNLYRAFLYPMRMYELDESNQPVHFNMYTGEAVSGYLYTNNGFWDTARTVYPLYSLIEIPEYEKILEGFLNTYKESGYLPKWLAPDDGGGMPGNLIDCVIADAAKKGIRMDLMPEFLEAMIHSAEVKSKGLPVGRAYCEEYNEYGYVPSDIHESVNNSLDYSYSDYCIAEVAKVLGNKEVEEKYQKRAFWYQHLFSKEKGFMLAKDREGNFRKEFDPTIWGGDYTEGSAWQSTFAVPQDIQGLIDLYGGKENFEDQIIRLANEKPTYLVDGYGHTIHEMAEMELNKFGQINIGNQPSFHLPYLYAFVGKSYYAQPMIKQMLTNLFHSGWQGYPGDEDNGSMASFYIFSSLGFYPFCPGSGEYIFGMPLFDFAEMHLSNGESFVITTQQNHDQHQFIDGVRRNQKPFTTSFITHDEIEKGGNLSFDLGIVPNPKAFSSTTLPFSMTKE